MKGARSPKGNFAARELSQDEALALVAKMQDGGRAYAEASAMGEGGQPR